MLIGYICGTTVSRSRNAAPNEYGHLWEEIEQNRPSTVKEKVDIGELISYQEELKKCSCCSEVLDNSYKYGYY